MNKIHNLYVVFTLMCLSIICGCSKDDDTKDEKVTNYHFYDEPILYFGITKAELISLESHTRVSSDDSKDAAYDYSQGVENCLIMYDFDDSEERLENVVATWQPKDNHELSKSELRQIGPFFQSKYTPVKQDEDGTIYFANGKTPESITMLIALMATKKGFMALYYPVTISEDNVKRLKQKFFKH